VFALKETNNHLNNLKDVPEKISHLEQALAVLQTCYNMENTADNKVRDLCDKRITKLENRMAENEKKFNEILESIIQTQNNIKSKQDTLQGGLLVVTPIIAFITWLITTFYDKMR
jgi:predicted RNase H-like nuclease (RuvC/YqgF family)